MKMKWWIAQGFWSIINSHSRSENLHWLSSELFMFNFEKCVQLNPDKRLVALFFEHFQVLGISSWAFLNVKFSFSVFLTLINAFWIVWILLTILMWSDCSKRFISDFQIWPQFGINSSRNVEIYYYHFCSFSLICQLSVVSFCWICL